MSLIEGWSALRRGDVESASNIFSGLNGPDARRGMAHVFIARDELDMALAVIQSNMEQPTALDFGVYADIQGKRGNRKGAEQMLQRFIQQTPHPYLQAVLGEQLVRQGEWGAGTSQFMMAVRGDQTGEATDHTMTVVADLSSAVAAGKLPSRLAVKFVDQISSALPGQTAFGQQMTMAKSAIRQGVAWSRTPTTARSSSPPPVRRVGSGGPPTSSAPPPPRSTQKRPKFVVRDASHRSHLTPPLLEVMKRDRSLNDFLQRGVADPGLPQWPSAHEKLDTEPAMIPKLLNYNRQQISQASGQLTEGTIGQEIMVERAAESLRTLCAEHSRRAMGYTASEVSRLEFMLWDGVFDQLKEVPKVYEPEGTTDVDIRVLALGGYLGYVAVRSFKGHWKFSPQLHNTTVRMGTSQLMPFQFANKWLVAEKHDADLFEFVRLASEHANKRTLRLGSDETFGLVGSALELRLAELWLDYIARPLISIREAREAIEVVMDSPAAVAFAIPKRFVPPVSFGTIGQIEDTAILGYSRQTGAFFHLASPKHFARFMSEVVPVFQPKMLPQLDSFFDNLHAPNVDLKPMEVLETKPHLYTLGIEGTEGAKSASWLLEYSGRTRSWTIERSD